MILRIARKELLDMLRDGRFRVLAGLVPVVSVVSLGAGWKAYADLAAQHRTAQQATREQWLTQPKKNPHSAAHYGVYAFKPASPLAMVDTGIDPYVGVAVWLEAHKQNEMKYRPAQDRTAVQRFGSMTGAEVLQVLVPLFIVLMAFSAFAGEREQGTLRQLLSVGARPRDLALGTRAHLGDERLGVGLDAQHGERAADLVIERLRAGNRRADALGHRRHEVLGGGFAVRTGDADDAQLARIKREAHDGLREAPERERRVIDHDLRHAVIDLALDDQQRSAAVDGLSGKQVPVCLFAASGHEDLTGGNLARIGLRLRGDGCLFGAAPRVHEAASDRVCDLRWCQCNHSSIPASRRAPRTSSLAEYASCAPATS